MRGLAAPLGYALLTLAVAGPLLAPGYVFALDHAMGPASAQFQARWISHNDDPIQSKGSYALLLLGLDAVGPMWLAQKLILFLPFFLAGYGAHRLAATRAGTAAATFAGLLYALSPFLYVRGVAGQTGVMWAYALAPWFLLAWLRHVDTNARWPFVAAVGLVALTAAFQAHGVVILMLLVGAHTLVRLARSGPRARWHALRAPLRLAGWSAIVNLAWLLPVLLAPRTTLSGIGAADRAFFATSAAGLGSPGLAALTLQGFWREAYVSPFPHPALLLVPAIVLLLTARGLQRRPDDAALAVAVAGGLGLLLAIAANAPMLAGLWDWFPLLRGFRDAHKFVALLALAYAFLAPAGLDALREDLRRLRWKRVAPLATLLVLVLPVATATPLLGGFGGQLRVTDYPEGWTEVEAHTASCDGAMLVLPWHLYMDMRWIPQVDARVTNPAKVHFSCPTLTSDDLELGDAASQASTPAIEYAGHWLKTEGFLHGNPQDIRTLGNLLAPIGVQYVLVLKESDWRDVAPQLDRQKDLRLVLDNEHARLYESTAARAHAWATTRVIPLDDWSELLPLSEQTPLAGIVFPMSASEAEVAGETRPLALSAARAGGWRIEGALAEGERVLVTPAPRAPKTAWTHEGPATMRSLGFVPVFVDASQGDVLRNEGAVLAWIAWSVSALGSVALLLSPLRRAVKHEHAPP